MSPSRHLRSGERNRGPICFARVHPRLAILHAYVRHELGRSDRSANDTLGCVCRSDELRNTIGSLIDFLRAIDGAREPLVDGGEGGKSIEIILAVYRSAETVSQVMRPLDD